MKRFLPLVITLALGQALQAQKMRDVFAAMPDSVLGIMTKNNRLDCIGAPPVRWRHGTESSHGGLSRIAADKELPGGDEAFAVGGHVVLYLCGTYLFRTDGRDEGSPLHTGLGNIARREMDVPSGVC